MKHTFAAKAKNMIEDLGFSFQKDESGYWLLCDAGNVVESDRTLGDLICRVAKELGI